MTKDKTNVIRILDKNKISYKYHIWEKATGENTGVELAQAFNHNPKQAFKTLVTTGKSGNHYVFMIPVEESLDLKKAAQAVKEKSITMLKSKDLLALTGYIHGGCSPIGMKKEFKTVLHETAQNFPSILFSAGRIGHMVEVNPEDLRKIIPYIFADVTV